MELLRGGLKTIRIRTSILLLHLLSHRSQPLECLHVPPVLLLPDDQPFTGKFLTSEAELEAFLHHAAVQYRAFGRPVCFPVSFAPQASYLFRRYMGILISQLPSDLFSKISIRSRPEDGAITAVQPTGGYEFQIYHQTLGHSEYTKLTMSRASVSEIHISQMPYGP